MTPYPKLPSRPSLDWLRNAARSLLKALRAGDAEALDRRASQAPGASTPTLSVAQLVVAREQGFPSWPALKAAVEARRARAVAKRLSPRRAIAQRVLDQLLADAAGGDPKVMAARPGVGRWCGVMVRDMLEARPAERAQVLAVLLEGLRHPSPQVRFECAHALDTFGDASCRAGLVALMDDPIPRVRWMAMHALACDACKDDLFGEGDDVRNQIAERALHDPSVQVRRHAISALAMAGGPRAIETLQVIVAHEKDAVALRNARAALRRLAPKPQARR